jgi:excisionase family DNA binding protein
MPKQIIPELLTVRQVAEMLDVTTRTVQRMVRRGDFPGAYQLPGGSHSTFVIPKSDLDAYLAAREQEQKKRHQSKD